MPKFKSDLPQVLHQADIHVFVIRRRQNKVPSILEFHPDLRQLALESFIFKIKHFVGRKGIESRK
jgi:hypothetical protein